MFDYTDRLSAALRARGADEALVRSAVRAVEPLEERDRVSAFGDPEDYAARLAPEPRRRPRVGLILLGLVLAVVLAIGLPVMAAAGVPATAALAPLSPVLALLALGAGVLAEFLRYLAAGRAATASRG
ncbi:hypothetical protein E7744_02370 [Citricoccus sp. SGAir0253]|uniref:hypothetical protein n=1 Tax=Citricoccus sp. SGAir0253 TaxID=2567881 RepID=UPI0010CCFB0B|nr:hypothetical protein [Citricoccus sp. SGAir0253]QCU77189.1 hypothetical protein E7744_02370 [Citricoccus sp. SGAir0253]